VNAFQIAALLGMSGMGGDHGVRDSEKVFSRDPRHLKAIEVSEFHFPQDSLYCVSDSVKSNTAEKCRLHLGRQEKNVHPEACIALSKPDLFMSFIRLQSPE
jgi:hypothetical protein